MTGHKLIEADILSSESGSIKITLTDGRVLVGKSWGILPLTDDETGEELDEECLAFKLDDGGYEDIIDSEIRSIEKI